MKLETFITKVKNYDGYIQKLLDKSYDGACPCFWSTKIIDGYKVEIHGHCWRTCPDYLEGKNYCTNNGLHLKSKMPRKDLMKLAKALKKSLDAQEWYSPYQIRLITKE